VPVVGVPRWPTTTEFTGREVQVWNETTEEVEFVPEEETILLGTNITKIELLVRDAFGEWHAGIKERPWTPYKGVQRKPVRQQST
jgi:hypothetical protein